MKRERAVWDKETSAYLLGKRKKIPMNKSIMGFMATSRKYGICFTSKLVVDWAEHKQLSETQEPFLFNLLVVFHVWLLRKKNMGGWGSISPGIIPVRHGFYTRRSERQLLSGVCTVKRATKDHKSGQFVLQHCRKTSLKAMLCARFITQIKCLATNLIVPVTKSCCGVENSSFSAQPMPFGTNL